MTTGILKGFREIDRKKQRTTNTKKKEQMEERYPISDKGKKKAKINAHSRLHCRFVPHSKSTSACPLNP